MATQEALVHTVARQILRGLRESLTIGGQQKRGPRPIVKVSGERPRRSPPGDAGGKATPFA